MPATITEEMETWGFAMRAQPSLDHPEPDPGGYLAIRLPGDPGLILTVDGVDPTHTDDEAPVTDEGRSRRLLSRLARSGLISAWHAFPVAGVVWVHVKLTREQAAACYALIDWDATEIEVWHGRRPEHAFLGD